MLTEITEKIIIRLIFSGIIAKGNKALRSLDDIAPNAMEFSEKKLIKFLNDNKDTEYGKKHNFSEIKSYEDFKSKVPLNEYADFVSYVDSMSEHGKDKVLTYEPVKVFTATNGTTGEPKLIPVTQESIDLSTVYTIPSIISCINNTYVEKGQKGIPKGKGIFLFEINDEKKSKSGIPIGAISSTSIKASNGYIEKITTTPREIITHKEYIDTRYVQLLFGLRSKEITWISSVYLTTVAGMFDYLATRWQDLCEDIEKGTIHEDVQMSEETRKSLVLKLKPDPRRAEELRKIFSSGFHKPVISLIWPKLSFITGIGTGCFRIHADRIRCLVGDNVVMHNTIISSSESIMALATRCDTEEFVLLPQAAFFEFIPEDTEDVNVTKTFGELEIGKRYEVVLTTLSGLYRYRIHDVFEVVDFHGQIPVVRFSYRKNVFINIAGEKTTEEDLQRAIRHFADKTGINVTEFAAYADYSVCPGRYHVLIETNGEIDKNRLSEYTDSLEDSFRQALNMGYQLERDAGCLRSIKLSIQQPQTHALYREMQIMKGACFNQ